MQKFVVVADEAIPFLKGVLEPFAEVRYYCGSQITKKELIDADALFIRTRTLVNAELLENTKVQFVASATIGLDHVDTKYLDSKKIVWTNAPASNADSVVCYVASALFSMSKKFGERLEGKTIGIIGAGNVGSRVADFAKTIGMKVLLCDPPRAAKEGSSNFLHRMDLVSRSDVISLHVPLINEGCYMTRRLVNAEFIGAMHSNAWLINASRGDVLDNSALRLALRGGSIGGAVLDVWENEPDIDRNLLELVDFGTSHIAGYSQDGKANATTAVVKKFAESFGIDALANFSVVLNTDLPILECDTHGKTPEEAISELYLRVYDIARDDSYLRMTPQLFELLRSNYPVRREPKAYKVKLINASLAFRHMLESLGFKLLK